MPHVLQGPDLYRNTGYSNSQGNTECIEFIRQTLNAPETLAFYLGQNTEGIQVLDQWKIQGEVLPRTIPWTPRRQGLSNNGNWSWAAPGLGLG